MEKSKRKKVLFISSTGGHLNELLQLAPMFEKYDYNIITEKDKTNEYLKINTEKECIICLMGQEVNFLNTYLYILF